MTDRPDSDVLVRFSGVSKRYDGRTMAVDRLDLDVRRGEFLSLLGASGSGKTTTLMMLAGFEHPTAGSIHLDGRPLDDVPPWRRQIGIVFQSYALFPHMTVGDNVAFPLRQRRVAARETADRVKAMLDLVRLDGFESRMPSQLSGGQQQRVALARALVFEPQLVLMDEPLGALDKRLREHMQVEIKRIHERLGVTIVYVTHDQGEALAMSDRIAVFAAGRIRQLATPEELYERPLDATVADFVGENNHMAGVLEGSAGPFHRVRCAGLPPFEATLVAPVATGGAVVVAVRPERIRLGGDGPAGFAATVESLLYLGDHVRVGLVAGSGRRLVARVPNDARTPRLAVGDRTAVSWRAEDCRAFPSDGGGDSEAEDGP